jgi:hypothetical protein
MNTEAAMQELNIQMTFESLVENIDENMNTAKYINHQMMLVDQGVYVHFVNNFLLICEKQEGTYRAAAMGMIDSGNGLTLIDSRALRDNDLFESALEKFSKLYDSNRITVQNLHGKYERAEIVGLISETWEELSQLKDNIVH